MAFPPIAPPPAGGPPKPPAAPGAGLDVALAPGAKAVRDSMVKALDEALKDAEFADSLETTGSVSFDVSKDEIEIETDDVVVKSGDAKPEGDKPAADKPPAPPFPPKG